MSGIKILESLAEDFNQVEILEHYNDYYKLRVPKGDRTIGFLFSFIEAKKQDFNISEYSAAQTTLEQIFQTFANLKIDEEPNRKFIITNGKLTTTNDDFKMKVSSIYDEGVPVKNQQKTKSMTI